MGFFKYVCRLPGSLVLVLMIAGCGGEQDDHAGHEDHNGHEEHSEHAEHSEHEDQGEHDGHHDRHDHHGAATTSGPGMAVSFADADQGIELVPAAMERLGLEFQPLSSFAADGGFVVPEEAVVFSERRALIYLRMGERLRPFEVSASADAGKRRIQLNQGVPVDAELVSSGSALLHLAYLTAFGATGSGHGH